VGGEITVERIGPLEVEEVLVTVRHWENWRRDLNMPAADTEGRVEAVEVKSMGGLSHGKELVDQGKVAEQVVEGMGIWSMWARWGREVGIYNTDPALGSETEGSSLHGCGRNQRWTDYSDCVDMTCTLSAMAMGLVRT
jgi:hypothetical protein